MYQIGKIEIALKVVSKIFPEIIWKMQFIVKKKVLCSAEKGSSFRPNQTVEVLPNSSAEPNVWSVTTPNTQSNDYVIF